MMIKTLYLTVFLFISNTTLHAESVSPATHSVPGGIAIINLDATYKNTSRAEFRGYRLLVRKTKTAWQAVVGLPLGIKPGAYKIRIIDRHGNKTFKNFTIKNKKYETSYITIKNKRMVSPTKKDIERHYQEKPLITDALKTWSDNENVDMQFSIPVEGRFSSPFGLKRIYNKQERIRRHTGLDIAAPTGTIIKSPAKGRVIRTGSYFFTGNTVFIDHGQGLITMYCHLNEINVSADQLLLQNEKIGTVGLTGRVSGAHLHWVVSLNNTKVDPQLFLE